MHPWQGRSRWRIACDTALRGKYGRPLRLFSTTNKLSMTTGHLRYLPDPHHALPSILHSQTTSSQHHLYYTRLKRLMSSRYVSLASFLFRAGKSTTAEALLPCIVKEGTNTGVWYFVEATISLCNARGSFCSAQVAPIRKLERRRMFGVVSFASKNFPNASLFKACQRWRPQHP